MNKQMRMRTINNQVQYQHWFLFDVSTTNAYILYFDVRTGTPMTFKQLRMKLAEQLIGTYKSRKGIGRPRKCPCPTSNPNPTSQTAHLPTHSSSSVRCVHCRQVRSPPRKKHTVWVCAQCEGNPPLSHSKK